MRRKVVVGRPFDLKVSVSSDARPVTTKAKDKSPSQAGVGEQWDIEIREGGGGVDLIDAVMRSLITLAVLLASTVGLGVAAWASLDQDTYAPLAAVWAVVGPIYTGMAVYYYSPRRRRG